MKNRASCWLTIAIVCICFLTPSALAQQEASLRDLALGIGSAAATNEAGKGVVVGPASGFAADSQAGADVIYQKGAGKQGNLEAESTTTYLIGYGRFPIKKTGGIGVRVLSAFGDAQGSSDFEQTAKRSSSELALSGGFVSKPITAGLELSYIMISESWRGESVSGVGTGEGSTSYIEPSFGVAANLSRRVRVGFTYKPELKHWFDTKAKWNGDGESTEYNSKEAEIHGHQFVLGARVPLNKKTDVYAGIARDTPTSTDHDGQYSVTYGGETRLTIGAEMSLAKGINPQGSIVNTSTPSRTTRAILAGVGANIKKQLKAAGLLGYGIVSKEAEDGSEGSLFIVGASLSASF